MVLTFGKHLRIEKNFGWGETAYLIHLASMRRMHGAMQVTLVAPRSVNACNMP
jgi:hypothetical protein